MPTWDEILLENERLEQRPIPPLEVLDKYLEIMAEHTGRTVICYMSGFTVSKPFPPDASYLSIVDQDMQGLMTCSNRVPKDGLDLILHLPGGDYEATKRIIHYLRATYGHIRVFIPHLAFSGATMIACAADEIWMGPYSSIGPTDPQIQINNVFVPVGAIIKEFERAFLEVSKDHSRAILWNERLKQIPIGMIDALETMLNNADKYLKELLEKWNCKNQPPEKIETIVNMLNSYEHHSSHGRGISLAEAIEHGLSVRNLVEDKELEECVLSVYHAAIILFQKTSIYKIIANNRGKRFIMHLSHSGK